MTPDQIYDALNEIFRDVFADDAITLRADSSAQNVKGWDSFNHIKIIVAVEGRFGIKMQTREIDQMKTVGDLVALIDSKTGR
jgi:acyl carrier protein